MNEETVTNKKKKKLTPEERKKETKSLVLCIVIAALIALGLRFFVFEFVNVDGPSSEPTLYTGETVFIEKVSLKFNEPKRGEIIVCTIPNVSGPVIKRVMGLPGETVEVRNGKFYVNGEQFENDVFTGVMNFDMEPVTIPEKNVFVMGDNRNHSFDSRRVGPVPEENIVGKAVCIIWPLDKIAGLTHQL